MPEEKEDIGESETKEEESGEGSELEELIGEAEEIPEKSNINENQFREFLQSSTEPAQTLERATGSQEELGGGVFFSTGVERGVQDNDESFGYDMQAQEDEEQKYQRNNSSAGGNLSNIDMSKVGRDVTTPQVGEAGRVSSFNSNNDSSIQERYQDPKGIDVSQEGRGDPFERSTLQEVDRKKSEYVSK